MLEKLLYPGSVVRDWKFDGAMAQEAENFIREMAGKGYRLKRLTRDYRALFVKDEKAGEKVFCAAVTSDRVSDMEMKLQSAFSEQGWTMIDEKDGLGVYEADACRNPEIPRRENKVCYEDVRDKTRFGTEAVCSGIMAACFVFQAVLKIRNAEMVEQAGFPPSASDRALPMIAFLFSAMMILALILNVITARNLRIRLDADREKKPFVGRTMVQVQNRLGAVFLCGILLLTAAEKIISPGQGVVILLFFVVLVWILNDGNLLMPKGTEWIPALLVLAVILLILCTRFFWF